MRASAYRRVLALPYQSPHLLIGVSARIYYPSLPVLDLGGVWTRTLHYLEQSVARWVMRGGALPVMVPAVESQSLAPIGQTELEHYAQALDGLLLQGGNDLSPATYGERALRPEWEGDAVRDRYELALVAEFVKAGKPVFGICRGMQLLNVAFGGTLYQDLPTQQPQTGHIHFASNAYEKNFHALEMASDGWLAGLYPQGRSCRVNSIHHQAVKDLAPCFRVEARCPLDGLVEAIWSTRHRYVAGVQWHPEFHPQGEAVVFNDAPMLNDFLAACRLSRGRIR